MIKYLVVTLSFLLLYCSCYKANNPLPGNSAPKFDIAVGGGYPNYAGGNIKDSTITFTVNDSSSLNFGLTFSLVSGNPVNYPITCYISDLPPGMSASQDSFVFKLNYNINFDLNVATDTGFYMANINVATTYDSLRIYPIRIHVLPVTDCAPAITGTYTGSDPCGHFSIGDIWYSYTATIATIPGYPHWVGIKNFRGLGDSIIVSAFVSCSGGIDIPLQTISGYTIYSRGQGHVVTDGNTSISIYGDTIVHAGDTQTCYLQLTQQ